MNEFLLERAEIDLNSLNKKLEFEHIEEIGLYYHSHGDINWPFIRKMSSGKVDSDGVYTINYLIEDNYVNGYGIISEYQQLQMKFKIKGDTRIFISNMFE
jgi:hypothetical protein